MVRGTSLTGGNSAAAHLIAFRSPDGALLTTVKGDGRYIRTDAQLRQSHPVGAIDAAARHVEVNPGRGAPANPDDWLDARQIWRQLPAQSPDRALLYLLIANGRDTRPTRDQIAVLDTQSLRRVRSIGLSRPVVSITISRDGKELYGFDTLGGTMLVIEASTGRELRQIEGVGPRPIFGVVVP